jgi:Protein of unknown function (DUF2846)
MFKKVILPILLVSLLAGCASVPMESAEKTSAAKQFPAPTEGKAGLYLYRYGTFGAALKKDIWLDGKCVGETARNTFFYEEVDAGIEHKISTESEFSPNDLVLKTENGKLYFIQQFIKFGVFVGGAGVKLVDEVEAKKQIQELNLATRGNCSDSPITAK